MKFQILNRWNASVVFECEVPDDEPNKVRFAVRLAVSQSKSLQDADLRAANLQAADLQAANLQAADLQAANLRAADLQAANLQDANLQAANLQAADLQAANLQDANLQDANLQDANLQDANLLPIRDDFWAVLSGEPTSVHGLRQALIEGRIDGSSYEGDCACLVGTMANVCGKPFDGMGILKPHASRPAERFFLAIRKGDKPETNQHAKLAVEWIDAWPPLKFIPAEQAAAV